MIQLSDLSKKYPDGVVFNKVNFRLNPGVRVGLVGPNGSGKTTLFRLIMGVEDPDGGQVERPKRLSFGYLPQEILASSSDSILEVVMEAIPALRELEGKIQACSHALAQNPEDALLTQRLGDLQRDFENKGGYEIEHEAKRILGGLGFENAQFSHPMDSFSGGWRMRVALGKILLSNPDILLLDEPTNHLDLSSLLWLEGFLKSWSGTLVLISHDRQFLDTSVGHILEIEHKKLLMYTGNYSAYQQQKILRREQQEAAYRQQQKEITSTERFIERFRYKESKAKQVQSRVKKLDRLDRIEAPDGQRKQMSLRIPQPERSPRILMKLEKVDKAYDRVEVFDGLSLSLERGQKIGLVGPNGAGKSTLLKLLAGVEQVTGGALLRTEGTSVSYFAQHQIEELDPELSIIDTIYAVAPTWTQTEVRSYLGGFLFSGIAVEKKVKILSGGETSRLALAKMLANPAHVLLLDEPTNHLDMDARDRVEEALTAYQGTLVCISHDRHFLNAVTNLTGEVGAGGVRFFQGNYEYYEWKQAQDQVAVTVNESGGKEGTDPGKKAVYLERKKVANRLKKLPDLIAEKESSILEQEEILKNPGNAAKYQTIQQALSARARLEEELLVLLEEEETLREKYEK